MREWAENYSRVAAAPDLSAISTANLERASNFAHSVRARELRKGWGGDQAAVNRALVDGLERELGHLDFELKKRYAARDAAHASLTTRISS